MSAGAVLVLLALLLARSGRQRGPSASSYDGMADGHTVWPVPTYYATDGTVYPAVVSSGMESQRRSKDGTLRPHRGLDVMYRRRSAEDRGEDPSGVIGADGFASSPMHFAPVGTPILAARAGKVYSVHERTDGGGWSVVLDHGKPWATYYTHLRWVGVDVGDVVTAGQPIGVMGGNLGDGSRVRHLHFEVWFQGHGASASVDVAADNVTDAWERRPWRP